VVLSALSTLGAIGTLAWAFQARIGSLAAALGALLLALSPFLYLTMRMETALFLLLIGACLRLADRPGPAGPAAAAALLLTRAEGAFLLLPLALRHRRLGRPLPPARDLIAPAVLLAGALTFNWITYGAPLAHTLRAKIDQGRSGLWGEWPVFLDAGYHLDWFFGGEPALAALLGALALWGLVAGWRRAEAWVLGAFLGLLLLFYVALNVPNYHWYAAPFYALGAFLAAAGLGDLLRRARERAGAAPRALATAAVVALAALPASRLAVISERALATAAAEPVYRRIGLWLRDHAASGSSLAAAEIGTLGWYSRLPLVDMLGLATPGHSRFLAERRFDAWLAASPVDLALVHDPPWPIEAVVVRAAERGRFARDPAFAFDGFRLYRATGDAGGEPIGERLARWRGLGASMERTTAARQILEDSRFDPVVIPGTGLRAVNLTADFWTRGSEPAGLAAANPGTAPTAVRIRLACVAPAAELPITVAIDDGAATTRHTFDAPGFLEVDLGTLASREQRLYILWTDRDWSPGPQDPRRLGVKIFPPTEDAGGS
jgi:hypothetical protein